MAARSLAPGTILSGRYQVAELIGESDLSAVYGATDQRGQTQVALKIFDQAVMTRAAALSEFQAQARHASGLGVEGIARAYDFGIDANSGVPFSTAERVGWPSLDRRVLAQGPLGIAELGKAMTVIARALEAAHAAKLIHRDLKPQNVFISPDNPEWVRITDFGMSAVRRGAPEAMGWGGPPGYTPHDAVDASQPGTPSADLFALGVIVFFALTRGTPFRSLRNPGFDPTAHWAELNHNLGSLVERAKEIGVALDPALDAWFARALSHQPAQRFATASEMARELASIADKASARGAGGPRAMPGIAAAIAQPLVFQPEPSPASLRLGGTVPLASAPPGIAQAHAAAPAAAAAAVPPAAYAPPVPYNPAAAPVAPAPIAAAPAYAAPVPAQTPFGPGGSPSVSDAEPIAGLPKKGSALPIIIGVGVLLLGGAAFAAYSLMGKGGEPTPAASTIVSSGSAPATPAPAATGPARAHFSCQPAACDWVVCDGKNVTGLNDEIEFTPGAHECSASRNGFGSKATSFTASPGEVTQVVFDLPALPPEIQQKAAAAAAAASPNKPAPAAAPTPAMTKPTTTTSKPTTTTPKDKPATKKKKCSAFLGCK